MNQKLLSICIPTNGVIDWVCPVLDSIFLQNVSSDLYEVIVTDNGTNSDFENLMEEYLKRYHNLIYLKTNAIQFLNEIEAYKKASGIFIKFVNHRMRMRKDTLVHLLSFIEKNIDEKPFVYFSNGTLGNDHIFICRSFNEFVSRLSYWSSWSGGMGFWKEDFDKIENDIKYNGLFPHTTILFNYKSRIKYIIDNNILFSELPKGKNKKGNYALFYAFLVEYPAILLNLYREGNISNKTFQKVKKENLEFVSGLYFDYIIRKKECSYNISNYKEYSEVFYSYKQLMLESLKYILKKIKWKLIKK